MLEAIEEKFEQFINNAYDIDIEGAGVKIQGQYTSDLAKIHPFKAAETGFLEYVIEIKIKDGESVWVKLLLT